MKPCDGCNDPYVSHAAPGLGPDDNDPRFRAGMPGGGGVNGMNCGGFYVSRNAHAKHRVADLALSKSSNQPQGSWSERFAFTPCACGLGLWYQHDRPSAMLAGQR